MTNIYTNISIFELSTIITKNHMSFEESPDVVYLDVVVSNINSGNSSNYAKVFAEYN